MAESTQPESLQSRRAFVLKSQNIQLQRHLNVLKEELDSKSGFVYEVDEDLLKIRDLLKSALTSLNVRFLSRVLSQKAPNKTSKAESGTSEQLKSCLQYLDALQRQIHRRIKDHLRDSSVEDRTPDFEFISEFVATSKTSSTVSLLDVCSGDLKHLNLKHVSRLESKLHSLYGRKSTCTFKITDLCQLKSCFDTFLVPNTLSEMPDRFRNLLANTEEELVTAMASLLSLSVIVPAAPSPSLERIRKLGLAALPTKEEMMSQFPTLSNSSRYRVYKSFTYVGPRLVNFGNN